MYLIITASSDAYIQNKIIDSSYRTTDANTGFAGTLDLFKLYGETTLPDAEASGAASTFALDTDSDGTPETAVELSRILIKFDYDKLTRQSTDNMDVTDSNFKAYLNLKTISAGQFTPKNFTIDVYPLAQAFDEGVGKDTIGFKDQDATNFLTASFSGATVNAWNSAGAGTLGAVGQADKDAFNTANFGLGSTSIKASQTFKEGGEDLRIDVTHLVSASITSQLTNHGFRISYKASEETDAKTRFVKRFASRHAKNPYIRPSLHVVWDDTISDNSQNAVFDHSNTLYFQNFLRGSESNLKIGGTTYSGASCVRLVLSSGSFAVTSSVSSVTGNTSGASRPGLYNASFTVNSNDATVIRTGPTYTDKVSDFAIKSGSLDLTTEWQLNDGSLTFYTGSVRLRQTDRYQGNFTSREPEITATNVADSYRFTDVVIFRLFGRDIAAEYKEKYGNVPQRRKSVIYDTVYYKVVDALSGDIAIPENRNQNATRVSTDSQGMFFELDMSSLHVGRNYYFVYTVLERGTETIVEAKDTTFKVVR